MIPWDDVKTSDQMFAARIRALSFLDEDVEIARRRVAEFRERKAARKDQGFPRALRKAPLKVGDLVLRYDNPRKTDLSTAAKFKPRWQGPYRIKTASVKGWYHLETLDGLPLSVTCHGEHLKVFRQDKDGWWSPDDDSSAPSRWERLFYSNPQARSVDQMNQEGETSPGEKDGLKTSPEVPSQLTNTGAGEERKLEIQLPYRDQAWRDQFESL
jgi:hypothetical protein